MKPCMYSVLLVALCGGLAGCRGGGNTELLELENAQLNERITQLEVALFDRDVVLKQYCQALKRCREETGEDADGKGAATNGNGLQPPDVELGPPSGRPREEAPQEPRAEPGPAPRFDGSDDERRQRSTGYRVPEDLSVFRVSIDPAQSGLLGDGSEAIAVALEPRNAAGQPLPVAGDLAIAAWDAALLERYCDDDEKCRLAYIAHWNFTAEEAAAALAETADGPQMRFRLTWPRPQSPGRRLKIFVNYRTADGRQLRADAPLPATPPGSRPASSTTVTRPRPDEAPEPAPTPAIVEPESPEDGSRSALGQRRSEWTAGPPDAGLLRPIARRQQPEPQRAQPRGPAPRAPVPRGPAPRVEEPPPPPSPPRRPRPQWSPERP